MIHPRRTVRLPLLRSVGLANFSLYKLSPELTVDINPGVFCLAGANGLGKSSFIAALNFGLTGGVAPPTVSIQHLPKYRRDASRYSEKYFTGRIDELDRATAEVSLKFEIGDLAFHLTRNFFEPDSLRYLAVSTAHGERIVEHDSRLDSEARQDAYEELIVQATGLETFDQFVFLQHFVLSFDEWRHLLFWNERATELVLYLALGLNPDLAKRADELRKAATGAGSLARNFQYQATTSRRELRSVTAQLKTQANVQPAVLDRYTEAQGQHEGLLTERHRLSQALRDARLEFAEASARQLTIRNQYESAFQGRMGDPSLSRLHPVIGLTLSDNQCRVCGTQHEDGPASITSALRTSECPLCATQLPQQPPKSESRRLLQELDAQLHDATSRASSAALTVGRLEREASDIEGTLTTVESEIALFEAENELSTAFLKGDVHAELQRRVKDLESAVDVAMMRKSEQLQLRAQAIDSLEPIQTELLSAWRAAEVEFVPRFRRLAESFIGLPLQVQLDLGPGAFGIAHLALSVNTTHRRNSEQLSESQRFFLDIALRMSLAQHMTGDGACCIYVDTPEGALDIAYEARAGDMFSKFVADGDQVVMTANVNTSQLLRRMAQRCGHRFMQLVRMTEWTTLSDVQSSEEQLFTDAYELIERALAGDDMASGSENG
ncbi:AAA family ATPase [Ornithinimicrobium ciconiae]|uniref:Nuclease SbcCD subunit C n=1 Tax=Ornithinimicrobium ciconiae TaxID=2594265 RepID=A0A516GDF6_9MICO|nr:AAA family ATPase [Ornithinimicrobium ciconiae]QDO89553.1 AAA family ATPase [Ornithinimicrobium ciconiae]